MVGGRCAAVEKVLGCVQKPLQGPLQGPLKPEPQCPRRRRLRGYVRASYSGRPVSFSGRLLGNATTHKALKRLRL